MKLVKSLPKFRHVRLDKLPESAVSVPPTSPFSGFISPGVVQHQLLIINLRQNLCLYVSSLTCTYNVYADISSLNDSFFGWDGQPTASTNAEIELLGDATLTIDSVITCADLLLIANSTTTTGHAEGRVAVAVVVAVIAPAVVATVPLTAEDVGGAGVRPQDVVASHEKCVRCWHRRAEIGMAPGHPQLCGRCVVNVLGKGETRKYA